VAAAVSLFTLLFVWTIATFPGEWLNEKLPAARIIPVQNTAPSYPGQIRGVIAWTSLNKLLFVDIDDAVSRKPASLFSGRLILPEIDVIDRAKLDTEEKIMAARTTLSLRGRRLEGAILTGAVLRKVDFTAAHLRGAFLQFSDLRGAVLACPDEVGGDPCTDLQGAYMVGG
jgi:uncharacterized protein YjbI with pentapeptide repeats